MAGHTKGIDGLLPEGPQAYCPDENGKCWKTPEAAELDRLRAVNADLLAALEMVVDSGEAWVGLTLKEQAQVTAAIAKAKGELDGKV